MSFEKVSSKEMNDKCYRKEVKSSLGWHKSENWLRSEVIAARTVIVVPRNEKLYITISESGEVE